MSTTEPPNQGGIKSDAYPGCWDGDSLLDDETGKPVPRLYQPGPRQLAASSGWSTIDFTNLYLGLDDTGQRTVRTVCLDGSAARFPEPIACLTFGERAELLAYVKSCVRDSGLLYVASSLAPNRVSGPSIHYLEEMEDIPVTRLGEAQTLRYEGDWIHKYGVEKDYFNAFGLAWTMAYRTEAPALLDELWMAAKEAKSTLQAIAKTLGRLARVAQPPF